MSNNDQLEIIHVDDGTGKPFDLFKVDNVLFPAYFCEDPVKRLEEVRNMPGRDDDVIIVAYPKAGRTLIGGISWFAPVGGFVALCTFVYTTTGTRQTVSN